MENPKVKSTAPKLHGDLKYFNGDQADFMSLVRNDGFPNTVNLTDM